MTEIFVFGSNLAGKHRRGAALWAKKHKGAIEGVGSGPQGDSYAIPTKCWAVNPLPLSLVKTHIDVFLEYARANPEKLFRLTPIGTGLAGRKHSEIKPMFAGSPDNVLWPSEWITGGADKKEFE